MICRAERVYRRTVTAPHRTKISSPCRTAWNRRWRMRFKVKSISHPPRMTPAISAAAGGSQKATICISRVREFSSRSSASSPRILPLWEMTAAANSTPVSESEVRKDKIPTYRPRGSYRRTIPFSPVRRSEKAFSTASASRSRSKSRSSGAPSSPASVSARNRTALNGRRYQTRSTAIEESLRSGITRRRTISRPLRTISPSPSRTRTDHHLATPNPRITSSTSTSSQTPEIQVEKSLQKSMKLRSSGRSSRRIYRLKASTTASGCCKTSFSLTISRRLSHPQEDVPLYRLGVPRL